MSNQFEGDPKIVLTPDGATIPFTGGQPVMDGGLENMVNISLFTKPGWAGNTLFRKQDEQIGSEYEDIAKGSITLSSINNTRQAAEKALKNPAFGDVAVDVVNVSGNRLDVKILIRPPGQDVQELILSRNGINWINQATNPANKRV